MDTLFTRAIAPPDRVEAVRLALADAIRGEYDALIEHALQQTMTLPGYDAIGPDQIRPNTRRAMTAIQEALQTPDYERYGGVLAAVARQRASQGFTPATLFQVVQLTEDVVGELALRHLPALADLACVSVLLRRICDRGRDVIIGAFQAAHLEARAEVERLARQFSAPILPALPGVLVLPVVGAVSEARAGELLAALLRGISDHSAHTVIVDITGLAESDARLPAYLQRASAAAGLLGARLVLVGISPAIAVQLAAAGPGPGLHVHATLATALHAASRARA